VLGEIHRVVSALLRRLGLAALLPWVVALASALLFAGCSAPAAKGGGLARVKKAGVLRWGGDVQGGEPYVYADPKDPNRLVGFEVEIAAAVARELGVRAEFVQNDWSHLVPSLERRTFDVILNGFEVTPSRIGKVVYSRPYYVFAERLMARKGDPSIVDFASLRGRKTGTLAGSLAFELLRGHADVVMYEGTEEPYQDLVTGRTDAVLLDDIIAARYGVPKPELRVVGDVRDGYYAVGVHPDDADLAAAIDAALGRISKSGELEQILTRSSLWNERQARLVAWSDADQDQMLGKPPPPPPLGRGHVWLFVKGAGVTLVVSTLAMGLAIPMGMLLALARLHGPRPLARLAGAYVEIYRGTPVLLQLYVLYYGLLPYLHLRQHLEARGLGALAALEPLFVACVGLGMNYAAYEAETYRAGIQAVPKGQTEAALSLGLSLPQTLRRVVLPQAFRHSLPNVTNDFIALLKDSSLVSVITVVELTKQMTITAVDVRGWLGPGLLCAALYFAMSYPLGRVARRLEAKLEGQRPKAAAP
jgi:polar amino acid transport system substrate-binding protein